MFHTQQLARQDLIPQLAPLSAHSAQLREARDDKKAGKNQVVNGSNYASKLPEDAPQTNHVDQDWLLSTKAINSIGDATNPNVQIVFHHFSSISRSDFVVCVVETWIWESVQQSVLCTGMKNKTIHELCQIVEPWLTARCVHQSSGHSTLFKPIF